MTQRRLKKSEVTPEVWQTHRKYRKKIASAKWYAKKKEREIREQNEHRQRLEAEYREREAAKQQMIWPDDRQRVYWRCVLEHHVRGYPSRRPEMDPYEYLRWVDTVEERIRATRTHLQQHGVVDWARHVPWDDDLGFVRILRQLGWRSCRSDDPAATEWVTGPYGVLWAGCVRRWGMTVGPAVARAVCQQITVQPTHSHSPPTHTGWANHHDTAQPVATPTQNDHQPDIQRWIAHTLFPDPASMIMSWYDSEDEDAWLEDWNRVRENERFLQKAEETTITVNPKDDDEDGESLPSSMDLYLNTVFGDPESLSQQEPLDSSWNLHDANRSPGYGPTHRGRYDEDDESDDSASPTPTSSSTDFQQQPTP